MTARLQRGASLQGAQESATGALTSCPEGQGAHAGLPGCAAKVFPVQARQESSPAPPPSNVVVPTGQALHCALRSLDHLPGGQSEQTGAPARLKVPALQLTQDCASVAAPAKLPLEPAGQGRQAPAS